MSRTLKTTLLAALLTGAASAQPVTPATPATPAAPTQQAPGQTRADQNKAGQDKPGQSKPGQPTAAEWTAQALGNASYAISEPVWEGSTSLVSAEQRAGIVAALRRDSEGALKRRYPQATFVPAGTPGAVKVTPAIVAPGALVPWAKMTVRLDVELPSGNRASLGESFGLLTLWQQGAEAANYAFDQLARQLP